MSVSKEQRRMPKSKRYAQRVNKAGDSPSVHAQAYRMKAGLWRDLLKGRLTVVPRENRTMFREGMLLVRDGLAEQQLLTKDTLYLVKSPTCDEAKLINALYVASVKATNSPGRDSTIGDIRKSRIDPNIKSVIKIQYQFKKRG